MHILHSLADDCDEQHLMLIERALQTPGFDTLSAQERQRMRDWVEGYVSRTAGTPEHG